MRTEVSRGRRGAPPDPAGCSPASAGLSASNRTITTPPPRVEHRPVHAGAPLSVRGVHHARKARADAACHAPLQRHLAAHVRARRHAGHDLHERFGAAHGHVAVGRALPRRRGPSASSTSDVQKPARPKLPSSVAQCGPSQPQGRPRGQKRLVAPAAGERRGRLRAQHHVGAHAAAPPSRSQSMNSGAAPTPPPTRSARVAPAGSHPRPTGPMSSTASAAAPASEAPSRASPAMCAVPKPTAGRALPACPPARRARTPRTGGAGTCASMPGTFMCTNCPARCAPRSAAPRASSDRGSGPPPRCRGCAPRSFTRASRSFPPCGARCAPRSSLGAARAPRRRVPWTARLPAERRPKPRHSHPASRRPVRRYTGPVRLSHPPWAKTRRILPARPRSRLRGRLPLRQVLQGHHRKAGVAPPLPCRPPWPAHPRAWSPA